MGKYVVENDNYNQPYVWYYRADNDRRPVQLLCGAELEQHPGGDRLWEAIVKMVENGQVGA
jgi:hypothetical protein